MHFFWLAGTSFLIAFSGAVAPGPLLAITVDRSLRGGWLAGPLVIVGHAMLECSLICLIVAGLGDFLKKDPVMFVLGIVGGALLIWMGQGMIRNAGRCEIAGSETGGASAGSSILWGIVGSVANPYWSIWWITVGLTYLAFALPYGYAGIAVFFAGHIFADAAWYTLVSYSVSKGKNRITPRRYRTLVCASGTFLCAFGLWLVVREVVF